MSERETAVVRLTKAKNFPHGCKRGRADWENARGKEIRVYLPAVENLGEFCETELTVWRVVEEDVETLSPNMAELVHDWTPEIGAYVCRHQLQNPPAPPADHQTRAGEPAEEPETR